jgi:hypothetical protein
MSHAHDKENVYLLPTYEISGIKLDCVETERLLGVHISKDLLKWNTWVARKEAVTNYEVCTAQPEGLYAQGETDGLPDHNHANPLLQHPCVAPKQNQDRTYRESAEPRAKIHSGSNPPVE